MSNHARMVILHNALTYKVGNPDPTSAREHEGMSISRIDFEVSPDGTAIALRVVYNDRFMTDERISHSGHFTVIKY